MIAIYLILLAMIIGALAAIQVKDLLSSVIAVGAVGMGFALLCLLLQAPDVAITQLVVEIIAVIILIRATVRKGLPAPEREDRVASGLVAVVFVAAFVAYGAWSLADLPVFGEPLMRTSARYIEGGAADTGAANLVTSVLLDYRAYDTLGEATVLFAAAMGVLAITRRVGRKPEEVETREQ